MIHQPERPERLLLPLTIHQPERPERLLLRRERHLELLPRPLLLLRNNGIFTAIFFFVVTFCQRPVRDSVCIWRLKGKLSF